MRGTNLLVATTTALAVAGAGAALGLEAAQSVCVGLVGLGAAGVFEVLWRCLGAERAGAVMGWTNSLVIVVGAGLSFGLAWPLALGAAAFGVGLSLAAERMGPKAEALVLAALAALVLHAFAHRRPAVQSAPRYDGDQALRAAHGEER